jgi:hypothetical protein
MLNVDTLNVVMLSAEGPVTIVLPQNRALYLKFVKHA